jgi:hypothetical protein
MKRLEELEFGDAAAGLPDAFHARVSPAPFPEPRLVAFSTAAATLIGLDPSEARRPEFARVFSGNELLPGMEPIASLYAGHQFGVYVPQLGDGRAMLLGRVVEGGVRWDLQLKGAGTTPFSRGGDGRAVLRSCIREFLGSEAMAGLGIPTTRALCVVGGAVPVYREEIEPGAMLLRLSPSHVRFGTFEVFFYRQQHERLAVLADHLISEHFPGLGGRADRCARLLDEVVERTARLMAAWQAVGFAHGVMNTDNFSMLGLTLDYGPFGFVEAFDPGFVCNHTDHAGRYAFDRQPYVGHWNCRALAQAMLPLVGREEALAALARYEPAFFAEWARLLRAKLGLATAREGDAELGGELLALMAGARVDYTRFWRALCELRLDPAAEQPALRDRFVEREAFDAWAARYRARLAAEGSDDEERRARMRAVNPKFVLRNYLAEQAIRRAHAGDFGMIEALRVVLATPFEEHPEREGWADEPPEWGRHLVVSCSS